MMDGFAARASEAEYGRELAIAGFAPAGAEQIQNGNAPMNCIEIMTGAILPNGADCVIPYEDTEKIDQHTIRITNKGPIATGDFVHAKGSDFETGKILIKAGIRLGSREIAAAATCGYAKLKVSKIPRIAIACSGDELVEVNQAPELHQIRRSNDFCIETALARLHLQSAERTHLPDERTTAQSKLQTLIHENDFVVLSGGVSMGKKDFLPDLLNELGLGCHFHGIAQKPGKPMGYWTNSTCAVFALPGNPLSTLTCLHHYVIPALFKAMGLTRMEETQMVSVDRTQSVRKDFTAFLPAKLNKDQTVTPCPPQNSGDLVRILHSDGYILIPAGEAAATAGETYEFRPWH